MDWLKIDCEGCEHTVLPQMLLTVPLPEQVSVEVHFGPTDVMTKPRMCVSQSDLIFARQIWQTFGMGQRLFQQLYALGGYFLISRLDLRAAYPAAGGCSELVFARAVRNISSRDNHRRALPRRR